MKKLFIISLFALTANFSIAQNSQKAKNLLDEVLHQSKKLRKYICRL